MARRRCAGPCGLNRDEKFFTGPRGKLCEFCRRATRQATARAARMRAVYDITMDDRKALSDHQGGVCAICGESRRYELHVDHDHAVEKVLGVRKSVRGLLCKGCNKLLRDVRDSIPKLRAAANYLQDPPARGIIT